MANRTTNWYTIYNTDPTKKQAQFLFETFDNVFDTRKNNV